jgi:hypothetical protein
MYSLLQRGHLPGVLRRSRFLNIKPHCLQVAGSTINLLDRNDLAMCRKWSRASFSFILKVLEISLKVSVSFSSTSAIF